MKGLLMKVRFVDFWNSFDDENNLFVDLLKLKYGHVQVVKQNNVWVDLEIVSVFQKIQSKLKSRVSHLLENRYLKNEFQDQAIYRRKSLDSISERRIFYTGENCRPPHKGYDASFSYDFDSYGNTNAYFPVWYLQVGIFNDYLENRLGIITNVSKLQQRRRLGNQRRKFAVAFVGNPHPVRMRAIEALSKKIGIDCFGTHFGREIPQKSELLNQYMYCLSFENDLFPGYVTEKLLEAYCMGTVPLFWGDIGQDEDINRDCYISATNFKDINEFTDYVVELPYDEFTHTYEQPFLLKTPDLTKIIQLL